MRPSSLNSLLFSTFILLLGALVLVTAAADRSLFVAECLSGGETCDTIELVRYRFTDGKLTSTERSLKLEVRDIRFDLGESRVIDDRFAVSHWGDIIDLREKTLLHEGDGQVLGIEDSLVFNEVNRRLNNEVVQGIFVFDLDSATYERLEPAGKWALPGALSPDQLQSAEASFDGVTLHHLSGTTRKIRTRLNVQLDHRSSTYGHPPLLWLDEHSMLTQESNGHLITIDLEGRKKSLVEMHEVSDEELPTSSPTLSRGPSGEILYQLGSKLFQIDVEDGKYESLAWRPAENEFAFELSQKDRSGRRIRHQGELIGTYWCSTHSAKTTPGYLAVEFGATGSNLGYPDGIAVWNENSGEWTEIEIDSLHGIIGWTDW